MIDTYRILQLPNPMATFWTKFAMVLSLYLYTDPIEDESEDQEYTLNGGSESSSDSVRTPETIRKKVKIEDT